ncbi:TonB-dependent receptor [Niabella ginsengisoli]|uniref:TonB-dependent receptor n=1 Tax=Niabella ginsengisoli TaxID=522298 RepID=UPI0021D43C9D|nr:TonB-dependent receptor [Niabella ginsengisoli]
MGELWFSLHPGTLNGFQFDNSLALVYGFNRNPDFKGTGINGAYLPLIPPARLLSSLSKKTIFKSGKIASITPIIEMETTFKQIRYFGYNNSETETPAYTLVSCGIQTQIRYGSQKTFSIQLQAANLFDKSYQSHLNRLKYFEYYNQSPNGRLGMYDMGRSINVKAILPF